MNIVTAKDQWTRIRPNLYARIWDGYVWRKEVNPLFYGGYRIHKVGVDTKLGQEWINARP
jgi:hypothetical protein